MNRKWWIVLVKELRDALRDRRSLRTLAVMTLLYPFLMWTALNNTITRQSRSETEVIRVGVSGAVQAPQLLAHLKQAGITTEAVTAADDAALQAAVADRRYVAVIRLADDFAQDHAALEPARLALWHDSVRTKPAQLDAVTAALQSYGREASMTRLTSHGVSLALLNPLVVDRFDTATPATRAGRHVAVLFGVFLLAIFYFGMDIAIDSSAGERERRSLEILLAQPVRGLDLVVGKWLAAAVFCAVGLALEFVAGHFLLQSLPLENIGLSWQVDAPHLALLYLIALPLCLLAPAAQIAIALNSRSFKEAQSSMMLVLVVALVPAFVPALGLDVQPWWYRVPLLAEQTLLLDMARDGAIDATHALRAMGTSLAIAAACILFAARRLASERYVINV
jgi:sodium transport system permease protein